MNPNFISVNITNLNVTSKVVVFIFSGQNVERGDDNSFYIDIIEPDPNAGHLSIGRFMDGWSRLESSIEFTLSNLLGVSHDVMPTIMNSLGARGQIDTIKHLGAAMFDEVVLARLEALTDRVGQANTRRNRIVHGHWALDVICREYSGRIRYKIVPYRIYTPSSPDEARAMHGNYDRSVREKYMFSVGKINILSKELAVLRDDINKFNEDIFG